MTDTVWFIAAIVFGLVAGGIYHRLLWLSVQKLATSTNAGRTLVVSGVLRLTALFGAFAIILFAGADAAAGAGFLLGIILSRCIALRWAKAGLKGV